MWKTHMDTRAEDPSGLVRRLFYFLALLRRLQTREERVGQATFN